MSNFNQIETAIKHYKGLGETETVKALMTEMYKILTGSKKWLMGVVGQRLGDATGTTAFYRVATKQQLLELVEMGGI